MIGIIVTVIEYDVPFLQRSSPSLFSGINNTSLNRSAYPTCCVDVLSTMEHSTTCLIVKLRSRDDYVDYRKFLPRHQIQSWAVAGCFR